MIVYDKEQKEIVIPNGIGNINLYNNGVEAGYNQGYEQGQADVAANARVLNVTENGNYLSRFSDPIIPTVTGVYADGADFYNCAELNGAVYNTKIKATGDSRLEFWFKGKNTTTENRNDVIIETNGRLRVAIEHFESNDKIVIYFGTVSAVVRGWTNAIWHHFIISKAEGFCIDGKRLMNIPSNADVDVNGLFFINGDGSYKNDRNSNGTFGMIKIDNTIIIPTADGFLNTNTGKFLEVEKDGGYTFTENLPIYGEGELYKTINVNVPDLNGSYDEGYAQGKIDGANEQKSKLESINITENGTYDREDGYNHIEVNVPDLNGSYDEGYEQGQADVAANARVLDVTENGNYLSKFSDPIIPANVTGVYADGTDFYSYAELKDKVFNTNIPATIDSRIELWYKGDNTLAGDAYNAIIGANYIDYSGVFEIIYYIYSNTEVSGRIGSTYLNTNWDENVWHHIILSVNDGFVVDGVKIGDMQSASFTPNGNFLINGNNYDNSRNANGCFGMIKIDDAVIIPTADGFKNVNTGELLEVVKDGTYTFTENLPIYPEGELYKTINVNVIPKINLQKEGLKLGYSRFTEVPEWADFDGVTNMESMFHYCQNLQTIPLINTSNVVNMINMFNTCQNLQAIPSLDTSNVTSMRGMFNYCERLQTIPLLNTSNVRDMTNMFNTCSKLQTIPPLNTSKVTDISNMFYGCYSLTSLPALDAQSLNMPSYMGIFGWNELSKLTDFGGFLNLKCSLANDDSIKRLPNLTYESCINVLNGLYDFTGNGETPGSNQGQLKVHQNFLDKVGDEISIGTAKGWQITV